MYIRAVVAVLALRLSVAPCGGASQPPSQPGANPLQQMSSQSQPTDSCMEDSGACAASFVQKSAWKKHGQEESRNGHKRRGGKGRAGKGGESGDTTTPEITLPPMESEPSRGSLHIEPSGGKGGKGESTPAPAEEEPTEPSGKGKEQEEIYNFPAEFEEHDAVWIGFPNAHYVEVGGSEDPYVKNRANGRTNRDVVTEIVYHLATHQITGHVCVVNSEQESLARSMFEKRGVDMAYVSFFDVPFGDSWLRDMGAPFLVGDKGGLKVLDMSFDEWSLGDADIYAWPYIWVDEHVDREIARHLDLPTYLAPDLVHEGGNTEVNGAGILMTTRDTVLRRNANKALTPQYGASTADDLGDLYKPWGREEEYIERRLLESYGQKKVLWMETGLAEDDTAWEGPFKASVEGPVYSYGVGGHIDEFARFVSKDTVLLVEVTNEEAAASPIAAETKKRMEANLKTLQEAVDEDGNKLNLNVIRLPSAPEVFTPLLPSNTTNTDGDELLYLLMSSYNYKCDANIPYKYCQDFPYGDPINMMSAASYANFLVTNGLVLAPKYCNEWAAPYEHEGCPPGAQAKDEEARRVFEQVFPGRDIVMIDVAPLNVCGGGIHCYTQQQPKRRTML